MFFRFLHTFFIVLLAITGFFVGAGIAFCFALFTTNKIKAFQNTAHLWARFLMFFSGVKVSVSGFNNIPLDRPAILVVNHQGAADIPILLAYLPGRFRFAIKKELFKIPCFGWYLKQAGYFSIDREAFRAAYRTLDTIAEIIKSGESVLVFPEGTRSWDGTLGKFKRGSLMAALKSGAPLIPIAISGSYNILPRGTKLLNPAAVKLSAGTPIYIRTEEEYENKVEAVRTAIERML